MVTSWNKSGFFLIVFEQIFIDCPHMICLMIYRVRLSCIVILRVWLLYSQLINPVLNLCVSIETYKLYTANVCLAILCTSRQQLHLKFINLKETHFWWNMRENSHIYWLGCACELLLLETSVLVSIYYIPIDIGHS